MSENTNNYTDLAPDIFRQRLVIEGLLYNAFAPEDMIRYCKEISTVLDMTPIGEPTTDHADEYGWCCFQHWKESGMHIYGWDHRERPFFSIDIYTCKPFEVDHAINYTQEFFDDNLVALSWKP